MLKSDSSSFTKILLLQKVRYYCWKLDNEIGGWEICNSVTFLRDSFYEFILKSWGTNKIESSDWCKLSYYSIWLKFFTKVVVLDVYLLWLPFYALNVAVNSLLLCFSLNYLSESFSLSYFSKLNYSFDKPFPSYSGFSITVVRAKSF